MSSETSNRKAPEKGALRRFLDWAVWLVQGIVGCTMLVALIIIGGIKDDSNVVQKPRRKPKPYDHGPIHWTLVVITEVAHALAYLPVMLGYVAFYLAAASFFVSCELLELVFGDQYKFNDIAMLMDDQRQCQRAAWFAITALVLPQRRTQLRN